MANATEFEREKVVRLFLTTENNSVSTISKKTALTESVVNGIINKYLKELKK